VTIKMSRTPGQIGPVPTPGQHTDEVLGRLLGYNADTLTDLRAAKSNRVTGTVVPWPPPDELEPATNEVAHEAP